MSRPRWKLNFFSSFIYKNLFYLKIKKLKKKKRILFNKAIVIPASYLNLNIIIHKGCTFKKLNINKYIIGMRFGSFIITRKPFYFPDNKKKSGKR